MHEHIAPAVYYLEVHLFYASIVCLAAWLLTSVWQGSATWKYWIWVATSVNFVIPLGGFYNRFGATSVSWATQLQGLDALGIEISRNLTIGGVLLAIWLCGVALMLARLLLRIRSDRRDGERAAGQDAAGLAAGFLARGVPVSLSGADRPPSVDGFLRPRISLPLGIEELLTRQELDAVLIHEVTHARRRDNLIGLMHEVALCALWFHPLVWFTGSRMAMFRELSCDDSVIDRSCGADLVSALAKFAVPLKSHSLRAGAATFLGHRLARLTAPERHGTSRVANSLLIVLFAAVLLAGVVETIAHTPSCFKVRILARQAPLPGLPLEAHATRDAMAVTQ